MTRTRDGAARSVGVLAILAAAAGATTTAQAATPPAGEQVVFPSDVTTVSVEYGTPVVVQRLPSITTRLASGATAEWRASLLGPAGLELLPGPDTGPTFTTEFNNRVTADVGTSLGRLDVTADVPLPRGDSYEVTGALPLAFEVRPAFASVTSTGPTSVDPGAAGQATVPVRASLDAGPVPGDITTARVDVREGNDVLCAALPVAADGTVGCDVSLARGTHAIAFEVGGNFRGSTTASVEVASPAPPPPAPVTVTQTTTLPAPPPVTTTTTTPAPPPVTTTTTTPAPPPVTTTVSALAPATTPVAAAPVLASPLVRLRLGSLRVQGSGVRVRVACPAPGVRCAGIVRVSRGGRTAGAVRYVASPGGTASVRVALPVGVRVAARRPGGAVVAITATNQVPGRATSRAGAARPPRGACAAEPL